MVVKVATTMIYNNIFALSVVGNTLRKRDTTSVDKTSTTSVAKPMAKALTTVVLIATVVQSARAIIAMGLLIMPMAFELLFWLVSTKTSINYLVIRLFRLFEFGVELGSLNCIFG